MVVQMNLDLLVSIDDTAMLIGDSLVAFIETKAGRALCAADRKHLLNIAGSALLIHMSLDDIV